MVCKEMECIEYVVILLLSASISFDVRLLFVLTSHFAGFEKFFEKLISGCRGDVELLLPILCLEKHMKLDVRRIWHCTRGDLEFTVGLGLRTFLFSKIE